MGARTVDEYVASHADWRRSTLEAIRGAIRAAAPDARESIKWAQPVYESNGPFADIKAFPRSVNVGFWRGAELDDPNGRLTGGERMRHMAIREGDPVEPELIGGWVRQAVALNEEHGNPTRRAGSAARDADR